MVALGLVKPRLVTETLVYCSKTSNLWAATGNFLQHTSLEKGSCLEPMFFRPTLQGPPTSKMEFDSTQVLPHLTKIRANGNSRKGPKTNQPDLRTSA